jgi:hypothetical protein
VTFGRITWQWVKRYSASDFVSNRPIVTACLGSG